MKDNCKLGNGTCGPDLKDFYPCIKDNYEFGYKKGTPCVFLKLSLNGNFTPQFYNETNIPEEMPERLKDVIKSNSRNGEKNSVSSKLKFGALEMMMNKFIRKSCGFRAEDFTTTTTTTWAQSLIFRTGTSPASGCHVQVKLAAPIRSSRFTSEDLRVSV